MVFLGAFFLKLPPNKKSFCKCKCIHKPTDYKQHAARGSLFCDGDRGVEGANDIKTKRIFHCYSYKAYNAPASNNIGSKSQSTVPARCNLQHNKNRHTIWHCEERVFASGIEFPISVIPNVPCRRFGSER